MPKDTFLRLSKDKQEKIKKGALKTFNRLNYEVVTVKDIVDDCEIPRGSFYQYFHDKFDVFKYLVTETQEEKVKYMQKPIEKIGEVSFLELYQELVQAGLNFAKDYPHIYKLGYQLYFSLDKDVKQFYEEMSVYSIAFIENLIIKDQEAGNTRTDIDAKVVATILHQLNTSDVVRMFFNQTPDEEIMAYTRHVLDILRYGIIRRES